MVSKYSGQQDIAITLKKRGVNRIFDFFDVSTIENPSKQISREVNCLPSRYSLDGVGTDWHGPFVVQAVKNGDGDIPECRHYTGGNHAYDNTGYLESSATGRTTSYAFYADGYPVTNQEGNCSRLEVRWSNRVQGCNTIREDGSGREILQENHVLTFDGKTWDSYVELIPLEKIRMLNWYGFQCNYTGEYYSKVRFVGGKNRGLLGNPSDSGNRECFRIEIVGPQDKIILELDPMLDLGKRELYGGETGAFAATYKKVYFNIIDESSDERLRIWDAGEMYVLRGKYIFEPM